VGPGSADQRPRRRRGRPHDRTRPRGGGRGADARRPADVAADRRRGEALQRGGQDRRLVERPRRDLHLDRQGRGRRTDRHVAGAGRRDGRTGYPAKTRCGQEFNGEVQGHVELRVRRRPRPRRAPVSRRRADGPVGGAAVAAAELPPRRPRPRLARRHADPRFARHAQEPARARRQHRTADRHAARRPVQVPARHDRRRARQEADRRGLQQHRRPRQRLGGGRDGQAGRVPRLRRRPRARPLQGHRVGHSRQADRGNREIRAPGVRQGARARLRLSGRRRGLRHHGRNLLGQAWRRGNTPGRTTPTAWPTMSGSASSWW
jgi:hypothetical protein